MTTKRAQSFIDEIWSFGNFYYATTPQIDQLFQRYFSRYYDVDDMKEHNYVLCPSVVSPEQFRIAHSVHRGIVYQSNLRGKGAGKKGSNLRDGIYALDAKKIKWQRKKLQMGFKKQREEQEGEGEGEGEGEQKQPQQSQQPPQQQQQQQQQPQQPQQQPQQQQPQQ